MERNLKGVTTTFDYPHPSHPHTFTPSHRSELGKSLNTDEAVALGAVYQGAGLTKLFRVKKFIVREGNIYPIQVCFPFPSPLPLHLTDYAPHLHTRTYTHIHLPPLTFPTLSHPLTYTLPPPSHIHTPPHPLTYTLPPTLSHTHSPPPSHIHTPLHPLTYTLPPPSHIHTPPYPLTYTLPPTLTHPHTITGIIHKTNTRRRWRRVCKDGQTNTLPSKQHTPSEESPHLQSLWQRLFIFRVLWRPQLPQ